MLPILALLCAMVLWGSSFIAMKIALRGFHPINMTFLRMLVGSFCFLPFLPSMLRALNYRKGDWKLLVGMAVCEPCLYFVFEGYAVRETSAAQAGMIVATLPLMVAVSAWFVFKERLSRTTWLGFAVALAGVVWLSAGAVAAEEAPNPVLGNILELVAMACATVYTLCVRKLSSNYAPFFITAVQSWVGLIFFAPSLLIPGMGLPENIAQEPLMAVVYLGGCVTLGAYGCFNYGISRLGAGRAAVFSNLIPVFTLLMGVFILGESLTFQQYLASGLVLAGVVVGTVASCRGKSC